MLQEILDALKSGTDATNALVSGPMAKIATGVSDLVAASDLTPIKTALDAKVQADAALADAINAVANEIPAAPAPAPATPAAE